MPRPSDAAAIDTPCAQLVRLCLRTFEGDPVALCPITNEDRAWVNSAVAYLARQDEEESSNGTPVPRPTGL